MRNGAWAALCGGLLVAVGCSGSKFDSADADDDGGGAGESGGSGKGPVGSGGEAGESGSSAKPGGARGGKGGSGGTKSDAGEAGDGAGGTGSPRGGKGGSGASDDGGEAGDAPVGQGGAGSLAGTGGATTAGAGGVAGDAASGGAGLGGQPAGSGGLGGATGGQAGGPAIECPLPFSMNRDGFVRVPAKAGCWSGYAFVGGDATSTVMPKNFENAMGILNMSGTVGAAVEPDYLGSVFLGINLNQDPDTSAKSAVVPTGTGITITCTGCSTPPMRAQLRGAKEWCAPLVSGIPIPYASFKTECWEGGVTQTPYAGEPIEAIELTIPGGGADAAFDFTLTKVVEH